MRSKRSFHFVSFKMETLDLYSWLFTHSNCLYALNSLNRGILFSKSFVQMSNELFILCVLIIYNKVRLIPILRTFSHSIFGRGHFFHDLIRVTFSHNIGKMSLLPNLNYRSCAVSINTPSIQNHVVL